MKKGDLIPYVSCKECKKVFRRRPAEELDNHVEAEHQIGDDKKSDQSPEGSEAALVAADRRHGLSLGKVQCLMMTMAAGYGAYQGWLQLREEGGAHAGFHSLCYRVW